DPRAGSREAQAQHAEQHEAGQQVDGEVEQVVAPRPAAERTLQPERGPHQRTIRARKLLRHGRVVEQERTGEAVRVAERADDDEPDPRKAFAPRTLDFAGGVAPGARVHGRARSCRRRYECRPEAPRIRLSGENAAPRSRRNPRWTPSDPCDNRAPQWSVTRS